MGAGSPERVRAALAAKRRLFALTDIIRAFDWLVAQLRGEVVAQVTSARASAMPR